MALSTYRVIVDGMYEDEFEEDDWRRAMERGLMGKIGGKYHVAVYEDGKRYHLATVFVDKYGDIAQFVVWEVKACP